MKKVRFYPKVKIAYMNRWLKIPRKQEKVLGIEWLAIEDVLKKEFEEIGKKIEYCLILFREQIRLDSI